MTELLTRLAAFVEDPYSRAREEKGRGGKIVGVTPMHFPEELIHASGALPVVLQESNEPVTSGYGYIYPFYCGYTRSNVDLAVKGRLDLFDAIVISDVCLQTRHLSMIMRHNLRIPFIYMQWPLEAKTERWLPVALERLRRCRQGLEESLGARITDEALEQSITLHNRNRRLLRRIYELRKTSPGALRATEAVALAMSSMLMPRGEHNQLLEELIPELEGREAGADGRVPVFLSGHLCQAVKRDILGLIEDEGLVVVGDDLYTGYRYLASDVPAGYSPLEALARRYFNLAVPCPTRSEPDREWGEYLVQAVTDSGARGIIVLVVKFCEAHMIYYPYIRERLNAAGIPHLMIETEHEVVSLEGVKTRVQAFREMLSK